MSDRQQTPTSPDSDIPQRVRDVARALPFRDEDDPTTALVWSDDDAEVVEYRSGRDGSVGVGLVPNYPSRVIMDHAESHLAAELRQPGAPTSVTMVINKVPCPGQEGCDATLPDIIPAGTRVNVYVQDLHGLRYYRVYYGNGKGIAQ